MDLSLRGLPLILPVWNRSADNGNVGAIDVFMRRIIDYAGMFPPANLPLDQAVANFEEYQRHPRADYLGSFIALATHDVRVPHAALVKENEIGANLRQLNADSLEVILPPTGVRDALALLDDSFPRRIMIELNWRQPFAPLMRLIAKRGARFGVKLRTGGVTPDTIPPADVVADF